MDCKRIAIKDIVDTNGLNVTATEISRYIGIDDLYEFCEALGKASMLLRDNHDRVVSKLATLNTRIKVAYYYKILKDGGKLDPISLKGNILVDGRRRLWAHIAFGDIEVDYVE